MGHEISPELFVEHLVQLFDLIKPKLKDSGSLWVNIADSYGTQSGTMLSGKMGGSSHKINYDWLTTSIVKPKSNSVRHKSLCLIPERFAIKMCEHGWILRNVVCWYSPNKCPESVLDRLSKKFEYVYFFTKKENYYFDLDALRIPVTQESLDRYQRAVNLGANAVNTKYKDRNIGVPKKAPKWFREMLGVEDVVQQEYEGKMCDNEEPEEFGSPRARTQRKSYLDRDSLNSINLKGSNPGNVWFIPWDEEGHSIWKINTEPSCEKHYAMFPMELPRRIIKAACPENGVVCDVFAGTFTTCGVAKERERSSIGIELNTEYINIGIKRFGFNNTFYDFKVIKC